MENIKNFLDNCMVMNTRPKGNDFDEKSNNKSTNVYGTLNYGKPPTRNRTDSESSNTSISSVSSVDSMTGGKAMPNQKDKDSYFWVMWHS